MKSRFLEMARGGSSSVNAEGSVITLIAISKALGAEARKHRVFAAAADDLHSPDFCNYELLRPNACGAKRPRAPAASPASLGAA